MARSQSNPYPNDPILDYRPPFVQSLPVQTLLTGISLTLTTVLLFHLIFTAQYHWPLARTNYALQVTGVVTLLVSICATVYVIFAATMRQSQHWPYMLSYLAIDMPAESKYGFNTTDPILLHKPPWTSAETTTWVAINATTAVIVQITHVHFLTLLFPSNLEARLIFSLLGPLAIIAAVMQILPLIYGTSIAAIALDTRNVCNAALSILFTSALLIWGFLVNRRQAWRTDGGTAAFGAGAILLALISTSLNLLYIPHQDQFSWMPNLMWAITLWQSFLGWWWWVGAGMGVREVEELLQRENKRQQKRLLRAQRRKEQREKAKLVWNGVTGAFKPHAKTDVPALDASHAPSQDGSSVSTDLALDSSALTRPLHMVQQWFARLRHAHLTAAHVQATERAERMHQVYQREEQRNVDRAHQRPVVGWGLGSFGIREAERERREEVEMQVRIPQGEDENEWKDMPVGEELVPGGQLRYRGADSSRPSGTVPEESPGTSMWWWGPLRQWRLKDSTRYR